MIFRNGPLLVRQNMPFSGREQYSLWLPFSCGIDFTMVKNLSGAEQQAQRSVGCCGPPDSSRWNLFFLAFSLCFFASQLLLTGLVIL